MIYVSIVLLVAIAALPWTDLVHASTVGQIVITTLALAAGVLMALLYNDDSVRKHRNG